MRLQVFGKMILGCLKESMKLTRNGYVCLAVLVCMAASRCAINQIRYFWESPNNATAVEDILVVAKPSEIDEPVKINIEKQLQKLPYEETCFCNVSLNGRESMINIYLFVHLTNGVLFSLVYSYKGP